MSDLNLFRLRDRGTVVTPVAQTSVPVEQSLQHLLERHLFAFLSVRVLASEYPTGRRHGGRIDTLGIAEHGSPVIIEYKRAVSRNLINQGLFYLDWLLDHRAEYRLLVDAQLGGTAGSAITWSAPRLICVAAKFSRNDLRAVRQINRTIELVRYRRFGRELLLLESVSVPRVARGVDRQDWEDL